MGNSRSNAGENGFNPPSTDIINYLSVLFAFNVTKESINESVKMGENGWVSAL